MTFSAVMERSGAPICEVSRGILAGADFSSDHFVQVCADLKVEWIHSTAGVPRGRGTALQGGTLLGQTLRSSQPMRAAMNAALAYVHSFTTSPDKVFHRTTSSGVGRTPRTASL